MKFEGDLRAWAAVKCRLQRMSHVMGLAGMLSSSFPFRISYFAYHLHLHSHFHPHPHPHFHSIIIIIIIVLACHNEEAAGGGICKCDNPMPGLPHIDTHTHTHTQTHMHTEERTHTGTVARHRT